jgi:hypothetical protein
MYIQQLYTNCLAEAAYYIESEGEAAIIDLSRDGARTLKWLRNAGPKSSTFLKRISMPICFGHIDLAKKTGAQIIYGPMADTKYKVYNAKDEKNLKLVS